MSDNLRKDVGHHEDLALSYQPTLVHFCVSLGSRPILLASSTRRISSPRPLCAVIDNTDSAFRFFTTGILNVECAVASFGKFNAAIPDVAHAKQHYLSPTSGGMDNSLHGGLR